MIIEHLLNPYPAGGYWFQTPANAQAFPALRVRKRDVSGAANVLGAERPAITQQGLELGGRDRAGEQEALAEGRAHAPQLICLLALLDALGDDLQVQALAEIDDPAHELTLARVGLDPVDERSVDLEDVDRVGLQAGERRVAGSEIVDGHAHADVLQLLELVDDLVAVVRQQALGHLEHERAGRQSGVAKHGGHAAGEGWIVQLPGGDVHIQVERTLRELAPPGRTLGAGRAQDPVAERDDQAGLFRQLDEMAGSQAPAGRMRPAHERLGTDDRARVELHDRLVVELEFLFLERALKLHPELQTVEHALVHTRLEALRVALSGALGHIHGGVGVSQEVVHRDGAVAVGDPDRGVDSELAAADVERRVQRLEQPRGDQVGIAVVIERLQQDGELVPAEPCRGVGYADHAGDSDRHRPQEVVTDRVAEAVVDRLEVVQIEEQDRDRTPVSPSWKAWWRSSSSSALRSLTSRIDRTTPPTAGSFKR